MANDELQFDGEAIKAAVSSLTSSKSKSKAGLLPRKTATSKTAATKSTAKKTTAKKTTTKKTAANKAPSKVTKASATSKPKSTSATPKKSTTAKTKTTTKQSSTTARARGLEADLKKNEGETYTRMELMDGIRLAVQEAGAEAIQKTLMAMVTDWTPILGEKLEKEAISLIVRKTKSQYSKSSPDQKKSLRALVYWIRNDFDLGKSLAASELTSGFAGNLDNASTGSTPLNLKPLNEK